MRDDSAEILFQSFLQEALVSSSDMESDVQSLMLSILHFLCQPQCCQPSKVPCKMGLERLCWRVTHLNHASFCFLTVARRGSCRPTRKLICFALSHSVKQRRSQKRDGHLPGAHLHGNTRGEVSGDQVIKLDQEYVECKRQMDSHDKLETQCFLELEGNAESRQLCCVWPGLCCV